MEEEFQTAPLEGKNNYIKKILRNANGYRNFNRARNKIMFSQNLHNEYDSGFRDLYIVDKILNNRKQKAQLSNDLKNTGTDKNCGIVCIRCILTPQFFKANLNFVS